MLISCDIIVQLKGRICVMACSLTRAIEGRVTYIECRLRKIYSREKEGDLTKSYDKTPYTKKN